MARGIRNFVNAMFLETLPTRAEIGNTAFRKNIMLTAMTEFDISIDSASAHYNHAFKQAKKYMPSQVEGLGREPAKNKGGRKRKEVEAIVPQVEEVADTTVESAPTVVIESPVEIVTTEPELVV